MLTKAAKLLLIGSAFLTIRCGITENLDQLDQQGDQPQRGERSDSNQAQSPLSEYYQSLGLSDEETPETEITSEKMSPAENLSDDAKVVFESVKALKDGYRDQLEAICSKNSELRESIKTQLDAIRDNSELDHEAKKALAEEIFAENKEAIEAEKEEFKACVDENKADLDVIKDQKKALADACLIKPEKPQGAGLAMGQGNGQQRPEFGSGGGQRKGPKEQRSFGMSGQSDAQGDAQMGQRPPRMDGEGQNAQGKEGKGPKKGKHKIQWNDELIAELEAQLLTDDCSAAIEAAQSTDL